MNNSKHIKYTIGLFLIFSIICEAKDPVPGLLKKLKKHPGLESAVTHLVFNNPKGRIHGHDSSRIDFSISKNSKEATVKFILPSTFKIHGDRLMKCTKQVETWKCKEIDI